MDEGIHALAEKKLRLDAAVLDGITASSKQTKAADNLAMSELLQNLIAGGHCCLTQFFEISRKGSRAADSLMVKSCVRSLRVTSLSPGSLQLQSWKS